jgi:hypothetical protein
MGVSFVTMDTIVGVGAGVLGIGMLIVGVGLFLYVAWLGVAGAATILKEVWNAVLRRKWE